MLGAIHGVAIDKEAAASLLQALETMPAHRYSEEGLQLLNDAGFRMVTLTNSPPTVGHKTPLENAGLDRFFERQFNIETCRAYKPPGLPQSNVVGRDLPDLAQQMIRAWR